MHFQRVWYYISDRRCDGRAVGDNGRRCRLLAGLTSVKEKTMEIPVIIVMWIVAAVALAIMNNDRMGKEVNSREKYWSRFS